MSSILCKLKSDGSYIGPPYNGGWFLNLSPKTRRRILAGIGAIATLPVIFGMLPHEDGSSNLTPEQIQAECLDQEPVGAELLQEDKNFICKHISSAINAENEFGVPKEVTLAMAILESSRGTSELAKYANNFHGLKANDQWDGKVYTKTTEEHVSEAQLDGYDFEGEARPLGDGMYSINVVRAKFKLFGSAEDGFMEFAKYIATRKIAGELTYADAFATNNDDGSTNPEVFLKALFNDVGYKYATDINYLVKVLGIFNRITPFIESLGDLTLSSDDTVDDERGDESDNAEVSYSPKSWDRLSSVEKGQFGNNKDEYETSLDNVQQTEPTPEGYDRFLAMVKDISNDVKESYHSDSLYPPNIEFRPSKKRPQPGITLHFTAWPKSAWGHDGVQFASSVYNNGIKNGVWGSANMYLAEDGTLYLITEPNQVAWNAGQFYSLEATGLEVPAEKQSGITSKQYEGIVYTIAWQWLSQYPDKIPTYEEMKKYIIGHGEITSVADVGNHTDFPRIIADEVAFQAYLFLQEYMK